MVVVVKSLNYASLPSSSSSHNTTASQRYMKYNMSSMLNLEEWRQKLFVRATSGRAKTKSCQDEKGEKGEKGEKEIKNEILNYEYNNTKRDEKYISISLDVDKVINTLSLHLEKIQSIDKKEKMIDKIKGDITYRTKDGRVLQAFHSCERGKILWDDIVYDDLKTWLAATNVTTPQRCYD